MIRAAIAIGSNSTRMLVADCTDRMTVLSRGREETLLMMGLNEHGLLTQEAIQRTVMAVAKLRLHAMAFGAEEIALMATSATRDAKNQQQFIDKLKEVTELDLRIISGEEEAALAFRAVAGPDRCLVVDIGGGSTELTYGTDGRILAARSVQVGASRLLKMQPIESVDDAHKMLAVARDALQNAMQTVLTDAAVPPALTGIGGSCTTSAAMLMGKEAHGEAVEGYTVSLDDVRTLLRDIAPLTPAARAQLPGLPKSRAHHMPHGLCILQAVMEAAGADTLTVSGRTNLDGFLMQFCC